jgi:hypothetical protein
MMPAKESVSHRRRSVNGKPWQDTRLSHAGGHRRFSVSEISALIGTGNSLASSHRAEVLIHSALGRARLELGDGRLQKESWYRQFDDAAKERHRELGRRLMMLLLQASRGEEQARLVREARKLGVEYGRTSLREKTTLTDALRAFLFFRDYIFEDLVGLTSGTENAPGTDPLQAYRRLNHFVNEILVSMIETYSRKRK